MSSILNTIIALKKAKVLSKSKTSEALKNLITRLQTLKRKLDEDYKEEDKIYECCKKRIIHPNSVDPQDKTSIDEYQNIRLNRLIVEHLARNNCYETANQISSEFNLEVLPLYTGDNHNTQNEYIPNKSDMSYKKPHQVDPSLLQNHPSAISGLNHYDLYYQNRLDKTSGAGTQMGNPSINIQNSNVYLDFNIYTQAQFPTGQDPQKNPKSPTQTMDFNTAKSSNNQNFDFNNLLASFGKDQSSKNNIFVDNSKYNPSLNFYPQSMTMRDTSRFGEISVGSQEHKEDSRWKQWQ